MTKAKLTRSILVSIIMVITMLMAFSTSGMAKVTVMKFATVHPATHPFGKALAAFEQSVEQKTAGSIDVQIYLSGALGQERDSLEGVQIGTVEGAVATTAVLAAFNKDFEIFSLPFLFENADHLRQTYTGPIGQKFAKKLEANNMLTWNCWVVGPRGVYTKKPINSITDLKGLKIRTLESPIYLDTWKALGTIPTPLPFGDVYSALQTGLVDGAEGSMLGLVTAKHGEVVKYFADIQYVISGNAVVVGKSFFDKLTETEKAAVKSSLDEASVLVKSLFDTQDAETLRTVQQDYKVTITNPNKSAFRDAVKGIYANYSAYQADIDQVLGKK